MRTPRTRNHGRLILIALGAGTVLCVAPAHARQTTAANEGAVGKHTSLAYGLDGVGNVVYFDATPDASGVPVNNLKYRRQAGPLPGDPWGAFVTIESAGNVWQWASCAVDSWGWVHVTYYKASGDAALKYSKRNPATGAWSAPAVIAGAGAPNMGKHSSLAIGWDNSLHVAFFNETTDDLMYLRALQPAPGVVVWDPAPIPVDTVGDVGRYCDIALHNIPNQNIRVHFSYYDASHAALKHAFGSVVVPWCPEFVDPPLPDPLTPDRGKWSSIAVSPEGKPRISYFDDTTNDLRIAWSELVLACGGWMNAPVDEAGTRGQYTSIALNTGGNPVISYHAGTGGDLWRARVPLVSGTFLLSNLDTPSATDLATVGQYTSIARHPSGGMGIAYYDVTNSALKYVFIPVP